MSQDEEPITESNRNSYTISEIPSKPFRITMEFPLFFTMLSMSLMITVINNIILYRTCVHSLNHSHEECKIFLSPAKNNMSQELEDEVQSYATFVTMLKTTIESVAPAILSFFLGVWSDTHGRKPLITWPLLGMSVTGGLIVVYSMMEDLGPWWYILTLLPVSLAGGFTVLFTGAYCYMSDVTSTEHRSLRMTILEASVSAGSVIGSLLCPKLIALVGNVYLLLISNTLVVIAYVFTVIYVRESLTGAVQGGLCSVLDLNLVREMFRDCFKKRPNRGRTQILLLAVANSLTIFIFYGLMSLDYMYTREKLHWATKQYTTYSAASTAITFFGSFFGVMLVQKYLRVSDLAFAIIAFLSAIAHYMIKAFAVTTWHMYLSVGIAMFKGLSSPLIRSLLTKILPVVDIAKVFALMGALEGVSPLISPTLFNSLYFATIKIFPGAIYILCSAITAVCVVFLGIVQYYRWRTTSITYENLTPGDSTSS
ncbi:probable peptidoglycan muropeptide transporter SLC46 [Epargyreus clarus]|uniref:probable peptidoglycan muropeptide transporter SLC46 n=1 Tax=Epargyreus clarus TaxID=520877 RepID=UPI003C2F96A4